MTEYELTVDQSRGRGRSIEVAFRSFVLTCLLLSVLVSQAAAQSHNFHHYDIDDGLMQVQVLAVHQDRIGNIWAGTYGGVSRYVGHTFYSYSTADGLADNVVEAIASDPAGQVWVGTTRGLCRFLPGEDRFECLDEPPLADSRIYTLYADGEGLWAGTDHGLFRIVADEVEARFHYPALPSDDVRSVVRDPAGRLWVGTSGGLSRQDSSTADFEQVDQRMVTALLVDDDRLWVGTERGLFVYRDGAIGVAPGLPAEARDAHVTEMTLDSGGRLWVATSLGLLRDQGDGFGLLNTNNGLLYELVFTIATDRDGLVWFGHDGGLSRWIPTAFTGYRRAHGLLDSFVRTIHQDGSNQLWLGTRSGIQVVPYRDGWDFADSSFITSADGLIDDRVYSIDFPEPGTALIATGHGVARWREGEGLVEIYTDDEGLPVNQTQALLTDSTGTTWIGTHTGTVVLREGVIHPVEDRGLGQAYVYRFREDSRGRIWAVARTGLFIHSPDGTVVRLVGSDGLSDATLWDIAPDPRSGMWVGSNGDGLFHISDEGEIRQFTTEHGLVDNFLWQVLVDARGHVWAYTNRGLTRFDGDEFHAYNRYDGLLHLEGGATGAWQSHDGSLWFASADGLMRYDPELTYPPPTAPRTILERVERNGRPIRAGQVLPHQPGSLDFHYAAMSFRAVSDLRYRYRLQGIGDQWSEPIRYRPVTFASLGSGSYEFQVQARLPGVDWDEAPVSTFPFSIQRAYWETVWFWALITMLVVAAMTLLVRWRLRRGEVQRRMLSILVRERTQELEKVNRLLEDAAITDPLTGLHNRRFLMNQIDKDIAQSLRAYAGPSLYANRDILFMMVDLDHFKKINDQHGHLVGDFVLRSFAELIKKELRESDYMVRWGGEEFLIVARQAEATCCNVIAERIMKATREARFSPREDSEPLRCTCSIGISHFPFLKGSPSALSWEQVIDIADAAVYMAKSEGRDRWVAIHGTDQSGTDNPEQFLARLKSEISVMSERGQVRIEREA